MALPDKWQALQAFWDSFGIPAYDENTVPYDIEMPYITYEAKTANMGVTLSLTAQLWYYSSSWVEISNKADEIAAYIGEGHKSIPIQGGYMVIWQRGPFAERAPESNDMVRRMLINISCEFYTAD